MSEKKIACEVCGSNDVPNVLNLGKHPLCDDLLKVGSENKCEEFEIEIALCSECLTAHQVHPVPKRKLFPDSYHYRSSLTQDVLSGMQSLVAKTKEEYGDLTGKKIVDIGCNDGSLLMYFRDEGAEVYGVEPTAAAECAVKNSIPVINDFFDPSSAKKMVEEIGCPDFITFTNVFAHIENIDELLESVMVLMGEHTRLIVENHYLGAVLDRYQFDTFYHEHPRTYSVTSFVKIAKRLGCFLESVEFPARYGGNIRVIIGPRASSKKQEQYINQLLSQEQNFFKKFQEMGVVIQEWLALKDELFEQVRCNDGKVYAKAFPGRAAILIKLLGLTEKDVAAVFEKPNSIKVGHYVPGTRIPILSDDLLLDIVPEPRKILNLAWHISDEINAYLTTQDEDIVCVDIFSPEKYK